MRTKWKGVLAMLFEDKFGRLLNDEEIGEIEPWEIDKLGIHVYEIEAF